MPHHGGRRTGARSGTPLGRLVVARCIDGPAHFPCGCTVLSCCRTATLLLLLTFHESKAISVSPLRKACGCVRAQATGEELGLGRP